MKLVATLSQRGRVSIPKALCERLSWRPGAKARVHPQGARVLMIVRARARSARRDRAGGKHDGRLPRSKRPRVMSVVYFAKARHEPTPAPFLSADDRPDAAVRRARPGDRRGAVRRRSPSRWRRRPRRSGRPFRLDRAAVRAHDRAHRRLCPRRWAGGGDGLPLRAVGRGGARRRAARARRRADRRRDDLLPSLCGSPRSARRSKRRSGRTSSPAAGVGPMAAFPGRARRDACHALVACGAVAAFVCAMAASLIGLTTRGALARRRRPPGGA